MCGTKALLLVCISVYYSKAMLPCMHCIRYIPVVVDFFSILLQNTLLVTKEERFKRTGFNDWLFLIVDK